MINRISNQKSNSNNKHWVDKKILRNEKAVKFLFLGFDYHLAYYKQVLDRIRNILFLSDPISIVDINNQKEVYFKLLNASLIYSAKEAINRAGVDEVSIGITGGIDSRLLFFALKQFLPIKKIYTFTLGCISQYDFEIMKKYSRRFLENHKFYETKNIYWDFNEEVEYRKKQNKIGVYSAKTHLYRYLTKLGVPLYNVHGFFGDSLLGGIRFSLDPVNRWQKALEQFIKKNNRFYLQELLIPYLNIYKYLPSKPYREIMGTDMYDYLDFGIRQYQRIFPEANENDTILTPFSEESWIRSILSISNLEERNKFFYKFIANQASDIFFELQEYKIESKSQHKQFRKKFLNDIYNEISISNLKNDDGSKYHYYLTSKNGQPLPGRQFCEFAEYHNNTSFRLMMESAFSRLIDRRIISKDYLDKVWISFLEGKREDAERVKGLVNFEINLSAKTIIL